MMTSSNGNIFRVTGPFCGEFTGPGEFPAQRPVTRSFDVFFYLRPNNRLSKQPWGWWFQTPSWSLWRQCNDDSGWSGNPIHYSDVIKGAMASQFFIQQPHDCFLICLCRRRSKKTSKLRVIGLCAGNSPVVVKFPAQMASNAENVSIWWRHHENIQHIICRKSQ